MTRSSAINKIFIVWVVILLPSILLFTAQSIAGKFGEDGSFAWNWLLGQVTPVLALLLAAIFSSPTRYWRNHVANLFRWRCAMAACLFQGISMLAILLVEPLIVSTIFELFDKTGVFMSILQGVVIAAVGAVVFDGR